MAMIGERPDKASRAGFHQQGRKSVNKHGTITVAQEDIPPFYSPHDHMLQQPGMSILALRGMGSNSFKYRRTF
ncbi:MAG: hypothetical protein SCH71_08720 [Desulfobulbaceae bacterium]|nr:hypothetical protein [Desulfobulbaceae bacterium]